MLNCSGLPVSDRKDKMKQSKQVMTRNVVEADACITFLKSRPKLEMVGLGLLYGLPGTGKTNYAQRMAFREGYLYLKPEATTTPKSFAQQLQLALYKRFNLGSIYRMELPITCSNAVWVFWKTMLIL